MTSSTAAGSSTKSTSPSCCATVAVKPSIRKLAASPTDLRSTISWSYVSMSMKTKYSPSMYENCMSRLSIVAVSTLTPALNVLSTTLPESTFFSLVRTKAGPLPGLTCWNSTTDQSWPPSSLSTRPFLRSFVEATVAESPGLTWTTPGRAPCLECEQLLGRDGE